MWILIGVTTGLAWFYPWDMLIKYYNTEIMVPSVIAVIVFWGIYACVDTLLYLPSMGYDLYSFFYNMWGKRKEKILEGQYVHMLLKVLEHDPTIGQKIRAINPQNTQQALAYSMLLCFIKDKHIPEHVKHMLHTWVPCDAVKITTLLYQRLGEVQSAYNVVKDHFFVGRMPPWMQAWAQDTTPGVLCLASVALPHTIPHTSWHPLLKRVMVAQMLTSHTVEDMKILIDYMPKDFMRDIVVRWAVLERMYFLDMGHKLDMLGTMYMHEDDLSSLYAWIHTGEPLALWQWRDVGHRLEKALGEHIKYVYIHSNALVYFDALAQWESQPQQIGGMIIRQTQQLLRQGLFCAAGMQYSAYVRHELDSGSL